MDALTNHALQRLAALVGNQDLAADPIHAAVVVNESSRLLPLFVEESADAWLVLHDVLDVAESGELAQEGQRLAEELLALTMTRS